MDTVLVLFETNDEFRREAAGIFKGYEVIYGEKNDTSDVSTETAKNITVIFGNPKADFLKLCPRLKWIQLGSAGANGFIDGELNKNVLLTCASGCYGHAVSEHMTAMTLALMKNLHLYRDAQSAQIWQSRGRIKSIQGSTVVIVGIGDIGSGYARRMKALGCYTIGVDILPYKKPDYLDELLSIQKLDDALGRADVAALAVPGTKHTAGLMGKHQFAKIRRGAILINACRGIVVDTEALCGAIESGVLGGAGLDVTDPEPLPPGHKLWKFENVIITPHAAGGRHLQQTADYIMQLFLRNARSFLQSGPMESLVDFETGYRIPDKALLC
ncbi:MAG: D-2-hydroxyacid dehydrogenase [Treponema sp.]|nr:D-2-hydroxyacid dehydrogenase [Treponema sp.]